MLNLHDRATQLKSLSKRDLIDVLEISEHAVRTGSRSEFDALIRMVMKVLPLHAIDVRVATIGESGEVVGTNDVITLNFPNAWFDEYRKQNLRTADPVTPHLFGGNGPLIWSKLRKQNQSPLQKRFYGTAAEFGLNDGFAYGQRFSGRRTGSFVSCISEDLAKHRRHETVLSLLAPQLQSALGRCLIGWGKQDVSLTARELEVLHGAKDGKTNIEIGRELEMSARAVKFHLENVIEKLGAKNRTEAVVIALAKGIIDW